LSKEVLESARHPTIKVAALQRRVTCCPGKLWGHTAWDKATFSM
jgi:hypothetical protein